MKGWVCSPAWVVPYPSLCSLPSSGGHSAQPTHCGQGGAAGKGELEIFPCCLGGKVADSAVLIIRNRKEII